MYNLPYFKEKDGELVLAFMKQHPFITLCGSDAACNPVATHLPVLFKERNGHLYLRGHLMRNTDHHKAFIQNSAVLAIFNGPHTYVSASWYTDPLQGSTWNYMMVHAKGNLQFLDETELPSVLQETTAYFENDNDSPSLFEKLPGEYVARLSKSIIPFEITVKEMANVFKLSQNRDEASYLNIIEKLQSGNEDAKQIAVEMQQRMSQLYRQHKSQA